MYFIPMGLFIKYFDPATYGTIVTNLNAGKDFANLTWENFFVGNLLPVTIGNIIGGAVLVGGIYWFIYLRRNHITSMNEVNSGGTDRLQSLDRENLTQARKLQEAGFYRRSLAHCTP